MPKLSRNGARLRPRPHVRQTGDEIVRRRSWGGVLPSGPHVSIRGSRLIDCASDEHGCFFIEERQNARNQ